MLTNEAKLALLQHNSNLITQLGHSERYDVPPHPHHIDSLGTINRQCNLNAQRTLKY